MRTDCDNWSAILRRRQYFLDFLPARYVLATCQPVQHQFFRSSIVRIITRTDAGALGFAKMHRAVLLFKRPSFCFVFTIVQAVERLTPSAFACASKERYPALIKAFAMGRVGTFRSPEISCSWNSIDSRRAVTLLALITLGILSPIDGVQSLQDPNLRTLANTSSLRLVDRDPYL